MLKIFKRKWETKTLRRIVLGQFRDEEVLVFELQESNYGEKRAFVHTDSKTKKVNYAYACGIIGQES